MIRKFSNTSDALIKITTVSFTATGTSGDVFKETTTPVMWAIVLSDNVGGGSFIRTVGPFVFSPPETPPDIYSIRSSYIENNPSASFVTDSLQVYLNGQLLSKGIEYQEAENGYQFSFVVGGDGLSEAPSSTDQISLIYRINEITSAGDLVVSQTYPDLSTGFNIHYSNLGNNVEVVAKVLYL